MKHLLDVNVLLAAIWNTHPQHNRAFTWLAGKSIVLRPLTELGFLRISTKGLNQCSDGESSGTARQIRQRTERRTNRRRSRSAEFQS
jgi:predicted nucleic acid-binding protein